MKKKAIVIGGGYAGLSSAALMARDGWDVTVLEKNDVPGGRGRLWKPEGYVFDMGPSWYLMPEVFDRLFTDCGEKREDYYELEQLDPAYRVYFEDQEAVDVPADHEAQRRLFAGLEDGGDEALDRYLAEAKYKYDVAMSDFLYRDYEKISDFFDYRLMTEGLKLHVFRKLDGHVRRFFKDHRARKLLEYAMVFLGSSPNNAPALYSLMSHVDMNLGVWFPKGGMGAVALGIAALAEKMGAVVETGAQVLGLETDGGRVSGVHYRRNGEAAGGKSVGMSGEGIEFLPADLVLNTADYAFADSSLLKPEMRNYKKRFWDRKTIAPSMFLAYLGVNRPLPELAHHNLYFSRDWDEHFKTIFDRPSWPENPCFYLSRISATQADMAPKGKENIFLLVPVAPDMDDGEDVRNAYFEKLLVHVKDRTGVDLADGLELKRIFTHRDFTSDYNAYKGTALGMAHTLMQTAVFRPARKSKKLDNLYHAGQYTHPGVGVPMVIIAAGLAAESARKHL